MKRQFELLQEFEKVISKSKSRISKLRYEIEKEHSEIKDMILQSYNHNLETMFLVEFDRYMIQFHKVTKYQLDTIHIDWFQINGKNNPYDPGKTPSNQEEAIQILNNIKNPSHCKIGSYEKFGFFDDINARYDRLDWIAEKTQEKNYLFEIEEKEFIKAMNVVYNHYTGRDLSSNEIKFYED